MRFAGRNSNFSFLDALVARVWTGWRDVLAWLLVVLVGCSPCTHSRGAHQMFDQIPQGGKLTDLEKR
jgi:hypothetical protein